MRNQALTTTSLRLVCAALLTLVPGLARAQTGVSVTDFKPECGTEGDLLLIEGSGFPAPPTATTTPNVTIGGVAATVLRSSATRILCRVGAGTPTGSATIEVEGVAAPKSYEVLLPGSPVILRQSTDTATPGQRVLLIGLRFGRHPSVTIGGANARSWGRRRALVVEVPNGVSGSADIVVTNARGLDNGACPGKLTIAASGGNPTITAVDPPNAAPGSRIVFKGSYLAPAGLMRIEWADGQGTVLPARGISNGFDKVYSYVPRGASAGTWTVTLATLPSRASTTYTVAAAAAPTITALRPDAGPPGTRFAVVGQHLIAWGGRPTIDFDGQSVPVFGFFRDPRTGEDVLFTRVPTGATPGAHPVTVTVGGQTSNARDFTVGQATLQVFSMWPTSPPPFGVVPIRITGQGFGAPRNPSLSVSFDPGAGPVLAGRILWNNDNVILVMPPGGRQNPLPSGSYTVTVQNGSQSAVAGTYTVP